MRRIILGISVFAFLLTSGTVFAQSDSFAVTGFERQQDGLDQVFNLTVKNDAGRDLVVNGRLIVLNVYDTSPPLSLPIDNLSIDASSEASTVLRWSNAPLLGQVRALLVLNVGPGKTLVEDFHFWIFPWQAFVILTGALFIFAGILLALLRVLRNIKRKSHIEGPGPEKSSKLKSTKKPPKKKSQKKKKRKLPSGMAGYVVEFGDTVVTVASRFGVTWEDIVRSNRLKPPYPLKPGKEILVPMHELHRPETSEDEGH